MNDLSIFAVDAPHIAIFVDCDGLTCDRNIYRAYPLQIHSIFGEFYHIALLVVVPHAVEYIAYQYSTRYTIGVELLDYIFGECPRSHTAPFEIEFHQL